jgi:hypothetical protein
MVRWPWAPWPLRMVWRVERGGRCSHIVGTAHFFPYSYARAFARLLRPVRSALFEGPLDEDSSQRIAEYGRTGANDLAGRLDPAAVARIEQILRDRQDHRGDVWLIPPREPVYFQAYTQGVRPWAAFFAIWAAYLGWRYSMDAEGYQVARKLGKQIGCLETLEEQLAVLDGIPIERIVRQLNDVTRWDAYRREYVRLFLAGDLPGLIALTSGFVTRGPVVVGERDARMFAAMRPVCEREDAVAFIGFPHVPGVTRLFEEAGWTVTQVTA